MYDIYEFYIKDKKITIDLEDKERVLARKWHPLRTTTTNYIFASYIHGNKKGHKAIALHRFIINAPEGMQVDHINNDPLDNRKSNLRICTHAQNQCNKRKYKNNTTGYKGVRYNKVSKKYVSQIQCGDVTIFHGGFKSPYMAWIDYQIQACKLHGEFANFGEDPNQSIIYEIEGE